MTGPRTDHGNSAPPMRPGGTQRKAARVIAGPPGRERLRAGQATAGQGLLSPGGGRVGGVPQGDPVVVPGGVVSLAKRDRTAHTVGMGRPAVAQSARAAQPVTSGTLEARMRSRAGGSQQPVLGQRLREQGAVPVVAYTRPQVRLGSLPPHPDPPGGAAMAGTHPRTTAPPATDTSGRSSWSRCSGGANSKLKPQWRASDRSRSLSAANASTTVRAEEAGVARSAVSAEEASVTRPDGRCRHPFGSKRNAPSTAVSVAA